MNQGKPTSGRVSNPPSIREQSAEVFVWRSAVGGFQTRPNERWAPLP